MNTLDITSALPRLLRELVDGTAPTGGYMLNRGDDGLLKGLDKLTAAEASEIVNGGSSIAAHVDHMTYYISLMNRWADGENPWKSADWSASWRRTSVNDEGWDKARGELARQVSIWLAVLSEPREVSEPELTGMIASVVHLGYHVGAIRQMNRKMIGPRAKNEQDAFTAPATRP